MAALPYYLDAQTGKIYGYLDGQSLHRALTTEFPGEYEHMAQSWCRQPGKDRKGNTNEARRQQLQQMLTKFLALRYPVAKNSLKSHVTWSGKIDEQICLTVKKPLSNEDVYNQIKRIFKQILPQ